MPTKRNNKRAAERLKAAGASTSRSLRKGAVQRETSAPQAELTSVPQTGQPHVPVACVGSSAGGLEALRKFVAAIRPNSGIAYVLIQHLDPTHASLTAELLAKHTPLPVIQVERDTPVQANHIYVIPPNKFMSIKAGVLQLLEPPTPRGSRLPIDYFLRTLAADREELGIGVILSGTGTDGTLGLKEIRAAGGITVAQSPDTAQYDGMPRSAINSGFVDQVLPPEEIPAALTKYVHFARPQHLPKRETAPAEPFSGHLQSIISLLRARTRFDFSGYKKGTLLRRVHRRMGLRHHATMEDYLQFLRTNSEEVTALHRDLMINVTRFFRDPEAWQYLEQEIIPRIFESKTEEAALRAWVPGCATGEEAYTLAILLIEFLHAQPRKCAVQIFASDVDSECLDVARAGSYPESVVTDISPERLERFFIKGEHNYTVKKELRDLVVFAPQNLISDPPFSRLDLISCRNVLIYLVPEVQRTITVLFHFALLAGGYLMLSSAETVGPREDQFESVSKKWRIYRRVGPSRQQRAPIAADSITPAFRGRPAAPPAPSAAARVGQHIERILLDRFAPASVVIDRKYRVIHFSGAIDDYLRHPSGEPTMDLMSLLRDGLQGQVRALIRKAIEENHVIRSPALRVKKGRRFESVRVTVEPMEAFRDMEGLLLVSFAEASDQKPPTTAAMSKAIEHPGDAVNPQLEYELKVTREDLQRTIEEMESSTEELTASNEEVMSVNEELQSTNEELETSKEELQSLNEELATVNNQLQVKVEELEGANNDLNNLLASTDIPTIFLDPELRIKRFTPACVELLNLIPADVGRPLLDFRARFSDEELPSDARRVVEKLTPMERELQTESHRFYIRRILPYRTADNRIEGVVITFLDITQRKAAEERTRFLATVLNDSNDAVIVHDLNGRIKVWNHGAMKMYGYSEEEALALNIRQLAPAGVPDIDAVFRGVHGGDVPSSFETQRLTRDGRTLDVWLTPTLLTGPEGKSIGIATTERDITHRKRIETSLQQVNTELESRVAERTAELERQITDRNKLVDQMKLYQRELRSLANQILVAEEKERRRLAIDLHDGLSQTLTLIRVKVGSLRGSPADQNSAQIREIAQLLDQALHAASTMTFELSPPVLHELGFVPAVRWLAEDIQRRYQVNIVVNEEGSMPLDVGTVAVVLFRCLRELLINAAKHAHAAHVRISFKHVDNHIELLVVDDGQGFDADFTPGRVPGEPGRGGFGLFSIRERLQHLGGRMKIQSAPGKGTSVTLTVPRSAMAPEEPESRP